MNITILKLDTELLDLIISILDIELQKGRSKNTHNIYSREVIFNSILPICKKYPFFLQCIVLISINLNLLFYQVLCVMMKL